MHNKTQPRGSKDKPEHIEPPEALKGVTVRHHPIFRQIVEATAAAALCLAPLSGALAQEEGVTQAEIDRASNHADAALDNLDSADDAPLLTGEDMDAALKDSSLNKPEPEAEAQAQDGAEAAGDAQSADAAAAEDNSRYLGAPPPVAPANDYNADSSGAYGAQQYGNQQDDRRARRERAAAAVEDGAWASLVRLELGLGWSAGASSYEDVYGADTTLSSFGPNGFLAVKFRLSPRVPLQIGLDASYSYHPWAQDPSNSSYYGGYNGSYMGMGNVTLTAFPTHNFYLMLGLGMGGLVQDLDAKITYRGDKTDRLKLGATGLAAAGVQFGLAKPFRIGLELRAYGGFFDKDSFGALGGYLVLSFF